MHTPVELVGIGRNEVKRLLGSAIRLRQDFGATSVRAPRASAFACSVCIMISISWSGHSSPFRLLDSLGKGLTQYLEGQIARAGPRATKRQTQRPCGRCV